MQKVAAVAFNARTAFVKFKEIKLNLLPTVPSNQENFYYASQCSLWAFFKVRKDHVYSQLGSELDSLGFEPTTFKDEEDYCYCVLNPMFYTAFFGQQKTKTGFLGVAGVSEIEFNLLVHPVSRSKHVPDLSLKEFLAGWEQHKVVGQYRIAVICNHIGAVYAGRQKYGEHKFVGDIDYSLNTYNNNSLEGANFGIDICVYPQDMAENEEAKILHLNISLDGLLPFHCDQCPMVVYGALPPEKSDATEQKPIGSIRNHLGLFKGYMATGNEQFSLSLGTEVGEHPLKDENGENIVGSEHWHQTCLNQLQQLISNQKPSAYLLFESQPVETEPRPFFVS